MKGFFVVLCYLAFVSAQKAFMKGDLLPLKVRSFKKNILMCLGQFSFVEKDSDPDRLLFSPILYARGSHL